MLKSRLSSQHNSGKLEIVPSLSAKKPRPYRRWLLFGSLVLLFLVGLAGFFSFLSVKERAERGLNHFQTVISRLNDNSNISLNIVTLDEFGEELRLAESEFKAAQENLGLYGLLLPLAESLPGPGYDLAKLPVFLELAQKAARLGGVTLEGLRPALAEPSNAPSGDKNRLLWLVEALATPQAQNRFTLATSLLDELAQYRARLDRARLNLSQTSRAIDLFDKQLPTLKEGLGLARELPPLLPEILGQERPATYLTLLQNSDELRPTGGYISAVGLVTLDKGRPNLVNFADSQAVDNPALPALTPPPPLALYMRAGSFLLRDANWWPDFPTSARQIVALYDQHQNRQVDNVVALDSRAVAYIFEALGPLDLPTYQERLTAQNFEERWRYYYLPPGTEPVGDWWLKRKDFAGVVFKELLNRLSNASIRDYVKLAQWLGRAVSEKHLQIYFNRPELQAQLARRGMDGAQAAISAQSDYLMVVEANVGFNKVDANIERKASYSLGYAGGEADIFASLTLTYTNRAGVRAGTTAGECVKVVKYDASYASMTNGCYWNYLRIYVPPGSRLRAARGFPPGTTPETLTENNRTVFAGQIIVPPGQSLSVSFDYILPKLSGNYRLTVQKQAGLPGLPFTVELNQPGVSRQWASVLEKDWHLETLSPDK